MNTLAGPTLIRVALADDHTLFRDGIKELLTADGGFEVVAEAGTGDHAVALVAEYWPDVLLLDAAMPGPGLATVIRRVRRSSPTTQVVVLTMHDDADLVREALDSGAAAYLTKAVPCDELVAAARSVCRDSQTVLLSISRRTLDELGERSDPPGHDTEEDRPDVPNRIVLTAREQEILRLIAGAMSNAQIATRLHVTQATVKRHLTNIYAKLNAVSRVDAIRKATAAKLLTVDARVDT